MFTRGIGEATDIVSKEMYTFEDKGGRSITLRPEGTASVVRSALEHHLTANGQSGQALLLRPDVPLRAPAGGPHAPVLADRRRGARHGRADRGRRGHRGAHGVLRRRGRAGASA